LNCDEVCWVLHILESEEEIQMNKSLMKAVLVHEYGSSDVLKLGEVERPQPQEGEVQKLNKCPPTR
jgi:hypothetical protein